jgi:hypothetical protein
MAAAEYASILVSAHSDLCSRMNLRRIAGGTFYKDIKLA